MKTLILDDNIFKTVAIQRALKDCGITDIKSVSDQESGMNYIYQCMKEEAPVDLIVTDMHYPLEPRAVADTEAGFKLIDRLEKEGLEIPIIICSSLNFKEPRVLGTVWYNEIRDIGRDFRELLKQLQ